jgi:hypothetical protein
MTDVPSHPQEKLTPAELVTIGLLYALKGVNQSAFYRWLFHNYGNLFPQLPERTRLFRRLATRSDWTDRFLEDAHLLAIADSYGVELIHPRRHGRDKTNQAKKGLSNHRWIAGVKVCALINAQGRIVDWQWDGANTHDQHFREMIARYPHTAVLTDSGFHGRQGNPDNLNLCRRGQCNARFLVETVFSLWTRFLSLKHITEQRSKTVQAHLSYAIAVFNIVQNLFASQPDQSGRIPLTMAGICL